VGAVMSSGLDNASYPALLSEITHVDGLTDMT
jgi:hypothetical protein